MRLLDLFCGAGIHVTGADGFFDEIVGVDLTPQPNYPYEFRQADAMDVLRERWESPIDVIHASPPCQAHTRAKHLRDAQGGESKYPDLLTPTLATLRQSPWKYVPWIVENVPGAPFDPEPGEHMTTLCGSMFGLGVRRHRQFLTNWDPGLAPACRHETQGRPWGVYHVPGDSIPQGGRTARDVEHGKQVMGVNSTRDLTWNELKEGFPPQYTRWVMGRLMAHIERSVVATAPRRTCLRRTP